MGLRIEKLLDERKASGVSQAEIARRAGISPGYLTEIKNRDKDPSVQTALRLADALGVTLYEILDDDALNQIGRIARLAQDTGAEGRAALEELARLLAVSATGEPPGRG